MGGMRKIAAILVADVVGYCRLAGADEDRTLSRLRGLRSDLIDPAIDAHHGRIVKRTGDGSIIEFRSVVDAVRCAVEVQNGMVERNAGLPPERRIELRVGIYLGDVVEEADGDLMGESVNIAAATRQGAALGVRNCGPPGRLGGRGIFDHAASLSLRSIEPPQLSDESLDEVPNLFATQAQAVDENPRNPVPAASRASPQGAALARSHPCAPDLGMSKSACCTSRRSATRCEATRHAKFCGSVSDVARPPRHTVAAQALLSQLRPFRRYSRVFFG